MGHVVVLVLFWLCSILIIVGVLMGFLLAWLVDRSW